MTPAARLKAAWRAGLPGSEADRAAANECLTALDAYEAGRKEHGTLTGEARHAIAVRRRELMG